MRDAVIAGKLAQGIGRDAKTDIAGCRLRGPCPHGEGRGERG